MLNTTPITTLVTPALHFAPFTTDDISNILPMLATSPSRTCDFTIGGIYLWKDYFMYSREIINKTLFIKGVAEDNLSQPAFSLPMGEMPLADSLHILRAYCEANNEAPLLSAVPEDRLDEIRSSFAVESITELPDWADYLYDIEPMSTFQGKKMSKKRNHVNRFRADHPDAVLEPLTEANIPDALEFLNRHSDLSPDKSITADYDLIQTAETLRRFGDFNYEGALLRVPGQGSVAFTPDFVTLEMASKATIEYQWVNALYGRFRVTQPKEIAIFAACLSAERRTDRARQAWSWSINMVVSSRSCTPSAYHVMMKI